MNTVINLGNIQLAIVSGGRLWNDGGTMFGVVPRVLWERKSPADAQHRILLDTNCVVVRASDSLGLIDTGYGGKIPAERRQRHAMDDGIPLVQNLSTIGIRPEDIDWVILTHLHFDHAGGATMTDESGHLRPVFPRARHIVQRSEWEDAVGNLPELAGSYFPSDFVPLEQAGLLDLVEGDSEIVPGVTTRLTGGHTRGHQVVCIESDRGSAVCLADLCPTTAHLPTFWTMAYDQFPLVVRREKPLLLSDIAAHRRVALFAHDPRIKAAHLSRDADNAWSAVPLQL